MTLDELRQLDAGGWFAPEFAGEKLPTLDEVIDLFNDTGVKLIVEYIYNKINSTVNVLYGARLDNTTDCRIRITVILSGLKKEAFSEAYS
jgi:hypothetical protein